MVKVLKNLFFFIMLIVEKIILFLYLEFNFVGLKGYLPYFQTLSAKWKAHKGSVLAELGYSVDIFAWWTQF